MRLANPLFLTLAPLLLLFLWTQYYKSQRRKPTVGFSDLELVRWSSAARPVWEGHIPLALTALTMLLLVAALARPQRGLGTQSVKSEGIDILLCIDTSGSMQAQDLVPNRLEAAKVVSKAFVEGRGNDRIGVVVYSGIAFTQCPLTTDHGTVMTLLDSIQLGMTQVDGTAIGTALATCVNRLKDVGGKSKVVILLTDGNSNVGEVDPLTAAELAAQFNIRVYCIGVGTHGAAPLPGMMGGLMRVDIDDESLTRIADATGGKYFRATDNQSLAKIYSEIDRLEKTEKPKEQVVRYGELFPWLVTPALLLLVASMLLSATRLRELP